MYAPSPMKATWPKDMMPVLPTNVCRPTTRMALIPKRSTMSYSLDPSVTTTNPASATAPTAAASTPAMALNAPVGPDGRSISARSRSDLWLTGSPRRRVLQALPAAGSPGGRSGGTQTPAGRQATAAGAMRRKRSRARRAQGRRRSPRNAAHPPRMIATNAAIVGVSPACDVTAPSRGSTSTATIPAMIPLIQNAARTTRFTRTPIS